MNKNYNVGVLTFEQYHGRKNLGSSRIRGHWLVDNWSEAELFKMGKEYNVVIYQKAYFIEHAKTFNGIKILDLCDPDWLSWQYRVKEMIDLCHAVTTSTEALAIALRRITDKPVLCIPDRVDLSKFKEKKIHNGDATKVCWYGYSENFEIIKPVLSILSKNKLELSVISDGQFNLPNIYSDKINVENIKWNADTVNQNILRSDFVINPHGNYGRWKFKSNNKTLTAWAIGMPVAENSEQLYRFIKCEERIKEIEIRTKELKELWSIEKSIEEYKKLIGDVSK